MAGRNDGDGESRGNGLLIISAVIVLVVVLLGVFVVVTSKGGDDRSSGATPQASGTGAASPSGGADDNGGGSSAGSSGTASGGCAPTDTDQKVPATAPDDVTWSLVKTVALPRSKSAGPMVVHGLTASCYAHTPLGAIMAAMNAGYRSVLAAPDTGPLKAQVLPSAGRTTLEEQLAAVDEGVKSGEMAQIAGFRVTAYTPQTAVITVVNGSAEAGTLKRSDTTVQWEDGDWKLVARADGSLSTPADPLRDMLGYIQFGGV